MAGERPRDELDEMTTRYDPVEILHTTTRILAKNVMVWVALVMSFALFAWCVFQPETPRIVAASIFMVVAMSFAAYWNPKR